MKHSYYIFTSLTLVFFFLSCSENKGEPSLDAITQQIIDNGMSVSENGCDTAIAFPYTSYFKWLPDKDRVSRWKFKMVYFKGQYYSRQEILNNKSESASIGYELI